VALRSGRSMATEHRELETVTSERQKPQFSVKKQRKTVRTAYGGFSCRSSQFLDLASPKAHSGFWTSQDSHLVTYPSRP
jgi:hypothetical protein